MNAKHLVSYCLLAWLALPVWLLPKRRGFVGIAVFSIVMELNQALFGVGHCRLWDLVPNFIGIGAAVSVVFVWRWNMGRRSGGLAAPQREKVDDAV